MRKYKDYLPEELKKYKEFQAIGDTVDKQFDKLETDKRRVLLNGFIMSLDDYGCTRWEKMLHLVRRDSDSLEDRRKRILIKFLNQLPYTEKRLREMLDSICGEDGYHLEVNITEECVRVKIELGRKNQFREVQKMLEDIVPLNLWLDVQLLYNTHRVLGGYTHRHLAKFTHRGLREEDLNGK